jgi:exodeoxyribonuclease-3
LRTRLPGFWLYNVYFPSGQRGQERVAFKLEFYRALLELCDRGHAQGEKIAICGDFNTAHREIDLHNPKSNQHTSGFLPEERAWIDRYLEHGFVDVYRSLYPERVEYTWWTYLHSLASGTWAGSWIISWSRSPGARRAGGDHTRGGGGSGSLPGQYDY